MATITPNSLASELNFDDENHLTGSQEMEVMNWEQLEEEVYSAQSQRKNGSRFLQSLNLREEIRKQLAEGDTERSHNGSGLRKSKSTFLDDTSSSDSDDGNFDEAVVGPLTDEDSESSCEDADNEKEFYLNDEFNTKVTLHKASPSSRFRSIDSSSLDLSDETISGRDKLVVRPLKSRPGLKTRIQNQQDLQICFLNDFPLREGSPALSTDSSDQFSNVRSDIPPLFTQDFWSPPAESTQKKNEFSMPKSKSMFEMDSEKARSEKVILRQFEESEMRWRQEMQLKIQQFHQRIHLCMQRQRKKHKKTPITTKVQFPFGKTRLDRSFLNDMSVAHLQIILNDLHGQIESLNEELVKNLEIRDELHMEQDSKLVDIDDLSRRLKDQWMANWRKQRMELAQSRHANSPQSEGSNSNTGSSTSSINGSLQNFRQRLKNLLS